MNEWVYWRSEAPPMGVVVELGRRESPDGEIKPDGRAKREDLRPEINAIGLWWRYPAGETSPKSP